MPPTGAALWRTLRAHQVYGANTGVGKTIVSAALCNAFQKSCGQAAFLKPVSTGPLDDADDRSVRRSFPVETFYDACSTVNFLQTYQALCTWSSDEMSLPV